MNKLATLPLAAGIAVLATGALAQQRAAVGGPSLWEAQTSSHGSENRARPASLDDQAKLLPHAHSANGKCTIIALEPGTASLCCEGQPGHHSHQSAQTPPPPPPAPPRPIPYGGRG